MTQPVFYAIVTKAQMSSHGCAVSFEAACARRGMRYERLVTDDITLSDIDALQLESGSLLYRISTGSKAQILESLLVLQRPSDFTTIYTPKMYPLPSRPYRELEEQIAAGLPIIPTLIIDETWRNMSEEDIEQRLQPLGGFPIVIKTLGLSHGQGVQKLDSAAALLELLGTIDWQSAEVIARKYLVDYRHYRLIVVAGKVVAAIEYHQPDDDFRTNASEEPHVTAVAVDELDPMLIATAVAGVDLRASLLGGVDILVDQTDNSPYLAEVNVPCYFARAEGPTGIDIAGAIIDAMLAKQQQER